MSRLDKRKPRVLVVDDSAASRAVIAEALEDGGCEVVGRAMDGGMALRMVADLQPDVITCDLEMPRLDGFTFLRMVAKNFPTPVIVVTLDSRPEAVLQALELGARDFVVKPGDSASKMRQLGPALTIRVRALAQEQNRDVKWAPTPNVSLPEKIELVAIGASTGGPRALRDVLSGVPGNFKPPIVIVQHMPKRFTAAFADRLRRHTGHDVAEGRDGEVLRPGVIRIGPGGFHMRVFEKSGSFVLELEEANEAERHVPSVDFLLETAALAAQEHLLAVVLTGMGRDGAEGAKTVAKVGAPLWTESAATAVIEGMPSAAAKSHPLAKELPLDELSGLLGKVLRTKAI
ncbi:MAG: chemotaxis-specific protein-glutamate methyltransferase CheB [Deltaproteobacteria bacterium]|nr:chemotaxis-specific protein-glutamate methyltransferase CheB [Deltaproteobacteria bacterium]